MDHSVLWTGDVATTQIQIPREVRILMVPGKSLLWRVAAWSAAGERMAVSDAGRFRVVRPAATP